MRGQDLYRRAKDIIPGGTQLLSKRPEMFLPENWPAYYASASGVKVTDLDGRTYIDMSIMGVGACVLGYADPDVDRAVKRAIESGAMCTLNAPEEVELAETLCGLHPWAAMARFARSGGEAMSMAVRIARARTGRDMVAFCGYHGWTDWYLAANLGDSSGLDGHLMPGLSPAGVPRGLKGTSVPFLYNRADQLKEIAEKNSGSLAAVVMEPQRDHAPRPGFLKEVREIARKAGAVLIFDEITTGFRMAPGGIHLIHGIEPDMAVFAKAMANGYAMAAVIGNADVMQAAQSTFISSTNWTERIGPVAALATIKKFIRDGAAVRINSAGSMVQNGWKRAAKMAGLEITVGELPSLAHFIFERDDAIALTTLFTQLMLERGFLAFNQFKPSLAHEDKHVAAYLAAAQECFMIIGEAARAGEVESLLKGPVARRGFYRLT